MYTKSAKIRVLSNDMIQANEIVHYDTSLSFSLPLSWSKPPNRDVF